MPRLPPPVPSERTCARPAGNQGARRFGSARRSASQRALRHASPEVAGALMALAGPTRHRPPGPRDDALRAARTCYDHLAGQLGVALADCMQARGHLLLSDGACLVTDGGRAVFAGFGLDLAADGPRPLCRACLE